MTSYVQWQRMVDRVARLRKIGGLPVLLAVCLLLLVGLQMHCVPGPAREIAQLEPMIPVATAQTFPGATRSAVGREGPEQESDQSVGAPEDLRPEPGPGNATEEPEDGSAESEAAPAATRLVIPALRVNAPVVEVPLANGTWDVSGLTYEVAHLGGTANPGENGNLALTGHITLRRGSGPFLHLEALQPGDLAIVYAEDQAYMYRVVNKRHVGPTDVSVTFPTSEPILTLITCTNWDAENRTYTERVAVIAELIGQEMP